MFCACSFPSFYHNVFHFNIAIWGGLKKSISKGLAQNCTEYNCDSALNHTATKLIVKTFAILFFCPKHIQFSGNTHNDCFGILQSYLHVTEKL
jgi:hypothetical protein